MTDKPMSPERLDKAIERLNEFVAGARGPYTNIVSDMKTVLAEIDAMRERAEKAERERDDFEKKPDDVCTCGHGLKAHSTRLGCLHVSRKATRDGYWVYCPCPSFTPKQKEPAHDR